MATWSPTGAGGGAGTHVDVRGTRVDVRAGERAHTAAEAARAASVEPTGIAKSIALLVAGARGESTDQSHAGSVGIFSRRTNQTQEAW
eukprot:7174179-Pyramimonas_sp.AAC.1